MQKLHFLAVAGLLLSTTACPVDIDDPFDTLTTTLTANDDVDTSTDAGTEDATTDATSTTDATTEATTEESTEGTCGGLGCACTDSTTCDAGLECVDGTCQLAGSDTTTETDTGMMLGDCADDDPWCPISAACTSGMFLSAMDSPYAWCWIMCDATAMDTSTCPTPPDGAMLTCVPVGMEGGCAALCTPGVTDCGQGADCIEVQPGTGICQYDNPNN
jgi:hypothetical protein